MKLHDSTRWPCGYGGLVALIHQANERTVAAITSLHSGAPTRPFTFSLFACDLATEVPVELHGEFFDGQVADAETLQQLAESERRHQMPLQGDRRNGR
ncbi:hypothetical protein [Streptomyces adustus]